MSLNYDKYLEEHVSNVNKAWDWMADNLPDIPIQPTTAYIFGHDRSKYTKKEYDAYDAYFYGNNRSFDVMNNFNYAWLHHIHNNPHHWQYWILINDDPKLGEVILDMPDIYIYEMIADWWSFSWHVNNLTEIFDWYNKRKDYIKLSPKTRTKVESILSQIKNKLDELNKV